MIAQGQEPNYLLDMFSFFSTVLTFLSNINVYFYGLKLPLKKKKKRRLT